MCLQLVNQITNAENSCLIMMLLMSAALKTKKKISLVQSTIQHLSLSNCFCVCVQAEMEMESLVMARKQLLQQWNSSLVGMRRRDEAFSTMQETIR